VTRAYMDMSNFSSAAWIWNAAHSVWLRSQDGQPDMNSDGTRMSAADVVILSVPIGPTGIYAAAGNQDPYVHLVGSGVAWVLRGGQEVQGTWTRPGITAPVQPTGTRGSITLAPRTTWLELLPRPYLPACIPGGSDESGIQFPWKPAGTLAGRWMVASGGAVKSALLMMRRSLASRRSS